MYDLGANLDSHNATILIVDDVEDNLEILGDLLTFDGYNVQTALSGQEAPVWHDDLAGIFVELCVLACHIATRQRVQCIHDVACVLVQADRLRRFQAK